MTLHLLNGRKEEQQHQQQQQQQIPFGNDKQEKQKKIPKGREARKARVRTKATATHRSHETAKDGPPKYGTKLQIRYEVSAWQ
jgi:hypothetical protein